MMVPTVGFLCALIVVGTLASVVATADPHAKLARFLGFPLLFAGVAALFLSLSLGMLAEFLDHKLGTFFCLGGLGFFGGYTLGGLGGALLGLRKVLKRK